ncbi:Fic family protein [Cupriavidus sp. UGS-1]|uniref:Fic family protein n=1 Tax=Cupriavidus sp. UGS-1 TaxID=2899826 RepID=UPI001E451693|nr:Fic family protein [Cupriavidus sp. UGS-1]MCD9120166.1 Fic family protein [Cupriavidus sp. UGS-1]
MSCNELEWAKTARTRPMTVRDEVLAALQQQSRTNAPWLSSTELKSKVRAGWTTVKRQLDALVRDGQVVREGRSRATRYRLAEGGQPVATVAPRPADRRGPAWSDESQAILAILSLPLGMREPVTYDRSFVDAYVPNVSTLLSPRLAAALAEEGRMSGQQPAGTYARKVLEPLLIDLSWASSRLEGNRYSLLATEQLFKSGITDGDLDAVMLLNHKAAIEFMVDAVPEYGLTTVLVRNVHAILMRDLLADASGLGGIRRKVVNITDTTYLPAQVPNLLEEMLGQIIEKARSIKNPVEASFFLWVNLAYLQPFEDGNKRTSRLSANIPLMLYNCAPLSFLDIEVRDYALAMMGVYEHRNIALAADLFEWAYRRSIRKYAVMLEAMGVPDPVRLQFREALNEAIGRVVRERQTAEEAIAAMSLQEDQSEVFRTLLDAELRSLDLHNCARYRLTLRQVEQWISAGRPR